MTTIEEAGYQITAVFMTILSTEQAEGFHQVYKYIVPEYQVAELRLFIEDIYSLRESFCCSFQGMVNELCSGPCIALEVKGSCKKNTHSEFRNLAGPFNLV